MDFRGFDYPRVGTVTALEVTRLEGRTIAVPQLPTGTIGSSLSVGPSGWIDGQGRFHDTP